MVFMSTLFLNSVCFLEEATFSSLLICYRQISYGFCQFHFYSLKVSFFFSFFFFFFF